MVSTAPNPSLTSTQVLAAWRRILTGKVPMLSIEITRECPLSCPGCYAYGEKHLGGEVTLRELSDLRGDALVDGVVQLVRKHQPLHPSFVGRQPLIRHRELTPLLPPLPDLRRTTLAPSAHNVCLSRIASIQSSWLRTAWRAQSFIPQASRMTASSPRCRQTSRPTCKAVSSLVFSVARRTAPNAVVPSAAPCT